MWDYEFETILYRTARRVTQRNMSQHTKTKQQQNNKKEIPPNLRQK